MMDNLLLAPRFLFRFAAPCRRLDKLWTGQGARLGDEHRLPSLAELDGRRTFADVRAAWSPQGLAFMVRVEGKQKAPWTRGTRIDESDGLRVWIDTRDTHNIHRATRFCHQLIFAPTGAGKEDAEPFAEAWPINRARENHRPIRGETLKLASKVGRGGYELAVHVPAGALTGFDPEEHPRLGFNYAVVDRELGVQTWSCPPDMPYAEDPSLWGTLDLTS